MDKSKTIVFNQSPPDRICPGFIYTRNGTIHAIRKHIESKEALAGGSKAVCVEEAADDGVVISALEIIEAGFFDKGLSLSAIWGGFMFVKKK